MLTGQNSREKASKRNRYFSKNHLKLQKTNGCFGRVERGVICVFAICHFLLINGLCMNSMGF
jgi:hypothetical protein